MFVRADASRGSPFGSACGLGAASALRPSDHPISLDDNRGSALTPSAGGHRADGTDRQAWSAVQGPPLNRLGYRPKPCAARIDPAVATLSAVR